MKAAIGAAAPSGAVENGCPLFPSKPHLGSARKNVMMVPQKSRSDALADRLVSSVHCIGPVSKYGLQFLYAERRLK
jgi:hypothetical protein